jgi:hypothetical protein
MAAYESAGVTTISGLDDVRMVDQWARDFALRRVLGDSSPIEGSSRLGPVR